MGIFQEAAIIAGDLITQPIRVKIIEFKTGKKQKITKIVEEGALMGDGTINPNIKNEFDAAMLAIQERRVVAVLNIHEKQVTWEIKPIN